jgi:hypothetical protein
MRKAKGRDMDVAAFFVVLRLASAPVAVGACAYPDEGGSEDGQSEGGDDQCEVHT